MWAPGAASETGSRPRRFPCSPAGGAATLEGDTPLPPTPNRPLATLAYRLFVVALTGLALVAQTVRLDSLYANVLGYAGAWAGQTTTSFMTVAVVDALLTLVSATVALLLVFRGRTERGARPLALVLSVWSYLLAYSALVAFLRPTDPTSTARLLFEAHFLVIEVVGLGALIRFASTFPRPLTLADLKSLDQLPAVVRPLQAARRALLSSGALWGSMALVVVVALLVNRALGQAAQDAALLPLVDVVRFGALALVVTNMRRSYLSATATERGRLHWLAFGFSVLLGSLSVLIGGNVLLTVTGWTVPVINWRPVVLGCGVAGMIGGAARAVMDEGDRSAARLFRGGMIASVLILATLLLASGFEALLSDAVVARLSLPSGLGTLAALALMGVVHTRLRVPLEVVFDHAWSGLPEPRAEADAAGPA